MLAFHFLFLLVFFLNALASASPGRDQLKCESQAAKFELLKGYDLQLNNSSTMALESYQKCLKLEPQCLDCHYEIGWSFWKLGEWRQVILHWEKLLKINSEYPKVRVFLEQAKRNLADIQAKKEKRIFRKGTEVLESSLPKDSPVKLTFISRWQSYNAEPDNPLDHYDLDIDSPKSVVFAPAGDKIYVHSLEGGKTIVFESEGFKKLQTIAHRFSPQNAHLVDSKAPFDYRFKNKTPQYFTGKPVESVFTHGGRYLWVTYYRRSFDELGQQPSALAIIDTKTNEIVRVMGTGSISKYIEVSPDQKLIAVSNWGDNSIGIYDIESDDFRKFEYKSLLTVESRLKLSKLKSNRDKDCGFCVRGLAFSKDGKYLFVSRMKGGGIAVFDLSRPSLVSRKEKFGKYLGTVFGIQPGPRDIHLSSDGETLYAGCNASGTIVKISVRSLLQKFGVSNSESSVLKDKRVGSVSATIPKDLRYDASGVVYSKAMVGAGLRSFKLSPDNRLLFAAVNNTSEVVILNADTLAVLGRMPVDSFPVGLSISPDGTRLWVTSQGKDHRGGNSVSVFLIKDYLKNQISLEN